VVTDPSVFPGLVTGGAFGVHRVSDCLAYATGWVSTGDHFNDGYLAGGSQGALLPLAVESSEPHRFAVPLPCNQPLPLPLLGLQRWRGE
jgi:hypothetical protein